MAQDDIGLVLGKFAPLHKGHQHLIEIAREENTQVIVLIYDAPDVTRIPLTTRANWIRTLYPDVRVIEARDGPQEVGYTPEIKRRHEAYILAQLNGTRIARFYSSELYGEHVSAALGAIDRRIDPQRSRISVSATAIRHDSNAWRDYVDPIVYRDLITKVVLLGAPSTGKTTLARELATHYQTVWMPEYGREYWEAHQDQRRLTAAQLLFIAQEHRRREEALFLHANRYIFIDTDATTTCQFSLYYHGNAHPELSALAAQTRERYDLFFVCDTDIPYDDTWDRSGDMQRMAFQQDILADLQQREIPYIILSGSLSQRITQVSQRLDNYRKHIA